jgi:hypothetical protein
MDIKKLNAIVEKVKKDLGDALIATDIWTTADGQSLAGFNPQPKATALMNQMVKRTNEALKEAKFPLLNRYFIHHLEGNHIATTTIIDDNHGWGILIDANKVQLGIFLNVVVPETMDAFKAVVAE